jgi:iron complex outermembrane receptor protein
MALSLPAGAQEARELEEVVVTARKREESLQEVPVSISVLGDQLLKDAGVYSQKDLFELTPGVHYDQGVDRNAALPSVRGIQANATATSRATVRAFIDGMPVLGSQGTIQLGNVRQIEFYRGPQSAAFGRATFGGAINYITKDPGQEFAGSVDLDINDYGRRIISGSVGAPITDTLGFLINGSYDDSTAPDEYIASDGTHYGTQSTKSIDGKLVFKPNDAVIAKLTYSHIESEDGPTVNYFISQSARDACYDRTFTTTGMSGVYGTGVIDCDWSQGGQIQAQNDRAAVLIRNGVTDPNILFLAAANSKPKDTVGSFNNKDRVSTQVDYSFANDSTLQFLGFYGEEDYVRGSDVSNNGTSPILIAASMGAFPYTVTTTGMGVIIGDIMSDPTDIEETYAEVRWLSPGEQRLRYLVGASYYDYSFLTQVYIQGYGAVLMGPEAVARYRALTGRDVSIPNLVVSETANNVGAYFNASYDFTDKFTGTLEGRYQTDKVSGSDPTSGRTEQVTTKSFLPRLSANYNLSPDTTFYAQVAKGNNPGGVNAGFLNAANIAVLDNGVGNPPVKYVGYDSSTFRFYKEETLYNYELGVKGNAFNRHLTYAVTLFRMDWKDQAQATNLNWDNPANTGAAAANTANRTFINQGDLTLQGVELEGTYFINDSWDLRGTFSYLDAKYTDYCSAGLIGTNLELTDLARFERRAQTGRAFDCYRSDGFEVANQPPISATLSPSYRGNVGSTQLMWNARADVRYESSAYIDAANVAKKPSITTANLSVGLSASMWNVAVYVNNVTDNDVPNLIAAGSDYSITTNTQPYPTNSQLTPVANPLTVPTTAASYQQSNYLITPRLPRTVGVRATVKF